MERQIDAIEAQYENIKKFLIKQKRKRVINRNRIKLGKSPRWYKEYYTRRTTSIECPSSLAIHYAHADAAFFFFTSPTSDFLDICDTLNFGGTIISGFIENVTKAKQYREELLKRPKKHANTKKAKEYNRTM